MNDNVDIGSVLTIFGIICLLVGYYTKPTNLISRNRKFGGYFGGTLFFISGIVFLLKGLFD